METGTWTMFDQNTMIDLPMFLLGRAPVLAAASDGVFGLGVTAFTGLVTASASAVALSFCGGDMIRTFASCLRPAGRPAAGEPRARVAGLSETASEPFRDEIRAFADILRKRGLDLDGTLARSSADGSVHVVRREGSSELEVMDRERFEVFQAELAASRSTLRVIRVEGDSLVALRYVAGRLDGPDCLEPAVVRVGAGGVTVDYWDRGRALRRDVVVEWEPEDDVVDLRDGPLLA